VQDFLQAVRSALALVGSLDPEFIGIVRLSLSISLSASVIAMIVGAPFGGVLAVARFRGRQTIIVLANALLGLPPVVVGLTIFCCRAPGRSALPDCCSRRRR
jgi:tungstate transport system permease protein